jgi:hypothetical protein
MAILNVRRTTTAAIAIHSIKYQVEAAQTTHLTQF